MALYVNGQKIEESEIEQEVARLRPEYEKAFAGQAPEKQREQLYEWSRENVIERVVLRQAALRDPEEIPPGLIEGEYQKMAERYGGKEQFAQRFGLSEEKERQIKKEIERRLRFDRLLERIANNAGPPSEEEARRYYEANLDKFMAPEMVRASHIVKHLAPEADSEEACEELRQILAQLRNGADFAEMAAKHSDCPDNGGDLGLFPRGQMVQEFEDVVFALEAGEISDVFQTNYGYHIARVAEKKPSAPRPFEEVRETIETELSEQLRQRSMEDFLDEEKARAAIEEK